MQTLSKIHPTLQQILDNFSDWFFQQDLTQLKIHRRDDFKKNLSYIECTERQYLEDALPTPERFGYPRDCYGIDMIVHRNETNQFPIYFDPILKKLDDDLMTFLGARNSALKMYYPPEGFIGWHNNGNAPGYNIVITYSRTGQGSFYSYDLNTKEIKEYKDKQGWNVKVGYFGRFSEPERVYWHSARTDCDRLTLSYIIYDKNIWDNMIEEIGTLDSQ
jgi:hypothetical protein